MHIAHFTNTYHPSISGVVRSVDSFRQALTELGHNVFVFTQDANDYQDTEPFIFRYLSLHLGLPNEFPATIPISPFMDRVLPVIKPDVIHSHHPIMLGQVAANKAEELKLPLIFTFHTRYREYSHYFPVPQETVQGIVRDAIDMWLKEYIKRCDHIVVPTDSMREALEEIYEIKDPITVVPTGIDIRPYVRAEGGPVRAKHGWTSKDFIIISVGRLTPEKGWPLLLDAAALVMKASPRVRLALVGEGFERRKLEKQAGELGITEKVDFIGKVPFEEIPAYLKAADLFAFASSTETQGLVTLEAMAAGLPVVAVDAIGTSDVVHNGKDGLLTDNNAEALASAILKLAKDKDTLERFRKASQRKAHSLDLLKQARRLISVYDEAIAAKKVKLATAAKKK
jgi:1,2-diacylglycerol 3-alpha-glucosyltransferase